MEAREEVVLAAVDLEDLAGVVLVEVVPEAVGRIIIVIK